MSQEKINLALTTCAQALEALTVSLGTFDKEPKNNLLKPLLKDTVIKRFEVLFEYVWKLLKKAAEYQGQEVPGPRIAIQEGLRYGWIEEPEYWALALDARNGSVHDYYAVSEDEYLEIARSLVPKTHELLKKVAGSLE